MPDLNTHINIKYFSILCVSLFYFTINQTIAQQIITGKVFDALSKKELPFATIKLGNTGKGVVTDLDGSFSLTTEKDITDIYISYLGYESKKVELAVANTRLLIYLQPKQGELKEVTITPPYEKIHHILNAAIANRNKNNPDKYDEYRCRVYYKMIADISFPDSTLKKLENDTGKDSKEALAFLTNQHILMSETNSIRTWEKPQHLQEVVVATKLSGFKKSLFTSLVTDALPFHAYTDYLALNGKDYHNPVCKGYEQRYDFNLNDEIIQGSDTIWILSFYPKKSVNELSGTVYINSDGYAIAYLLANAIDTNLKHTVRVEQQYAKTDSKWFPQHLNYIFVFTLKATKNVFYDLVMKGNSNIDSVSWKINDGFKFDKMHTVQLLPNADEMNDSSWVNLRPIALDNKEMRTYKVMDSIMDIIHFDKIIPYLSKLPEGKVPISIFDLDLKRLYTYNKYEKYRLGVGLQTNEQVIKWLSLGGWFGYGTGDRESKYGGFGEIILDKYREFVFRAGYDNDLRDPGRVLLNKDLDRNYLRSYLMSRVDNIESYYASVKKRLGYWNVTLAGQRQKITPQYAYALLYDGYTYTQFTANEISLNLRYAYAERTAPVFGYYTSLGTKYPIWYGKLSSGLLESNNMQTNYTQAVSALLWHKHINRLGFEHLLLEAGKNWSEKPLPISKLFAGNGFRYDQASLYVFGGIMTMYPYDYYSDQFISFCWRHDFDWKLYKLQKPKNSLSSAPYLSIGYNMLYGTMTQPEAHKIVAFSVPDNGYHEIGFSFNSIIRLKYLQLYYITLNVGYFYHLTPLSDLNKNGRIVYGVGVEL